MKKKIFINLLAVISIAIFSLSIFAKDIDDFEYELDTIRKKLESNESKLTGMEKEISAIHMEVLELDKEIEKYTKMYNSIEEKKRKAEKEVNDAKKELENSKDEVEEVNIQLLKNLRSVYETGSIRRSDILFSSKSIKEYLTRYTTIMDILDFNRQQYTGKQKKKERKAILKTTIESKTIELKTLGKDLEVKNKDLEAKKASRQKYVDKLKVSKEMILTQNQMLVKQEDSLNNDLEKEVQSLLNQKYKEGAITAGTPNAQGFVWPFPAGGVVTAGFPNYPASFGGGRHDGFDIAPRGATDLRLVATKAGTVIKVVSNRPQNTFPYAMTYGNHIIIMHDDGVTTTLYGHLESTAVEVGQRVETGQVIGILGNSGYSTGAHVHFEIRINGVAHNPQDYVGRN